MRRQVTHLCPFKDERDLGTLEAAWEGDGVEFYELEEFVVGLQDQPRMTHERFTDAIRDWLGARASQVEVETTWSTAGFAVRVESR